MHAGLASVSAGVGPPSAQSGTVFWITGLSGAGKTTVGRELWSRLRSAGRAAVFLDGDVIRDAIADDLGHSGDDRRQSARRNSRTCRLLADQGLDVVCSTISMFHEVRRWNRENIVGYREIYLRVPMHELERRDPKGIYARARSDKPANVVGIDVPAEFPDAADVVLDSPDSTPGDLRAMAADIRAAVDHAEHLIGALLILARNERGLTVREETDLATVAEDILDVVGLCGRRVHATLEPAVISGDPMLAERLIANLVDNAVRYNTAAGDIWISTRTAAGSAQLTVANTGPVISPADAGRIFQPFQRLSDRTSHDGSGLGLAIVASIAAIHGGTATARPRNDGGLSVTVTIPWAGAPAQGTGIQAPERPGVPRPG